MAQPKRSYLKAVGLLFAVSSLFSCAPREERQLNLIPKPAQMELRNGYFKADSNLVFDSGSIRYVINGEGNPEGYSLEVNKEGIVVKRLLMRASSMASRRSSSFIHRRDILTSRLLMRLVSATVVCTSMSLAISSPRRRSLNC